MVDDELEPLITQCPNCNTQFRVTESQLAVASGRVRCGACLTVFQGVEHLILDEETPPFTTGVEADAALDALLDELEPVRAPEGATRLYGGFEDVAQTREVEQVGLEDVDPAADADEDRVRRAEAGDAVEAIEEEEEDALRSEGIEAGALEAGALETGALEAADARAGSEEDYERWIDRSTASIDQLVEEVVASGRAAARGRSGAWAAADVLDAGDAPADTVAAGSSEQPVSEISFAPEPRRWWAGAVAALFVVLLVIQVAYLQLPEWSREPSLRPAYELVCGLLGCELPEMRALDALRTRNLVVRSHPATGGALIVDAAIVNTARFAQRYPDLELRFTSVTGELVAGRRFSPDEYLPEDFEGARSMPPDTPVQVSLEIVDPGPDAVNYTLSFR